MSGRDDATATTNIFVDLLDTCVIGGTMKSIYDATNGYIIATKSLWFGSQQVGREGGFLRDDNVSLPLQYWEANGYWFWKLWWLTYFRHWDGWRYANEACK